MGSLRTAAGGQTFTAPVKLTFYYGSPTPMAAHRRLQTPAAASARRLNEGNDMLGPPALVPRVTSPKAKNTASRRRTVAGSGGPVDYEQV